MTTSPYFFIQTALDDRVLDIDPTGDSSLGGPVVVVNPRRTTDNDTQLWQMAVDGHIVNKGTGLVLDVQGGVAENGRPVIVYPEHADSPPNQLWTLNAYGQLVTRLDETLVLDVYGAWSGPGVRVIVYPRKIGPVAQRANQSWRLLREVPELAGGSGTALRLAGAGQMVRLPAPDIGEGDFTIEAWLRSTTGGPVVSSGMRMVVGSPGMVLGVLSDGALRFGMSRGGMFGLFGFQLVTSGATNALDGEWHHLACVRAGTEARLYLDGEPLEPVPPMAGALTPAAPVRLDAPSWLWLGSAVPPPSMPVQWPGSALPIPLDTYELSGDLDEVRIWTEARTPEQIRAGVHHLVDRRSPGLAGLWSFDYADATDGSLAARHGTLVGEPQFIPSELDLTPPGEPYVLAQAKLIQDWTVDPADPSGHREISGYRVVLSLRDADDTALSGFVTIAADEPVQLHLFDGKVVTAGPDGDCTLATTAAGQLSFTVPADGALTCPMLAVRADFMATDARILVAPDRQVHLAMAAVTGNMLLGRDASGRKLPEVEANLKPSPLPAGTSAEVAEAVAQAVSHVMSAAAQHEVRPGRPLTRSRDVGPAGDPPRPYTAGHVDAAVAEQGYSAGSDTIGTHLVAGRGPVQRLIVPGRAPTPHWAYDIANAEFHPLTADGVAALRQGMTVQHLDDVTRTLRLDELALAGDRQVVLRSDQLLNAGSGRLARRGLGDLLHVLAEAEHVVVSTVQAVVTDVVTEVEQVVDTLVVTVVDAARQAYDFVVQTVEDAVDFVGGLLRRVGADIEAFVQFLRELFAWDDILASQRLMEHCLVRAKGLIKLALRGAAGDAVAAIEDFRQRMDTQFDEWRAGIGGMTLQRHADATATAPPRDIQSGYLPSMIDHSAAQSVDIDLPDGALADVAERLAAKIIRILERMAETLPGQIDPDEVVAAFGNPRQLLGAGLDLLLQVLEALVNGALAFAEEVITTLAEVLDEMVDALWALGTTRLDVPLVTAFYENVVLRGQGSMTPFGLLTLAAAVPFTLAEKLATGRTGPVFSAEDTAALMAMDPRDYPLMRNRYVHPTGARAVGQLSEAGTRQFNQAMGAGYCVFVFVWGGLAVYNDVIWIGKRAIAGSSAGTERPQWKFRSRWSALLLAAQSLCLLTSAPFDPDTATPADGMSLALWASQSIPLFSNGLAVGLHIAGKRSASVQQWAVWHERRGDPALTGAYGMAATVLSLVLAVLRGARIKDEQVDAGLEAGANIAGALSWVPQFFKPYNFFNNARFAVGCVVAEGFLYAAVAVLVASRTAINTRP